MKKIQSQDKGNYVFMLVNNNQMINKHLNKKIQNYKNRQIHIKNIQNHH